MATELGENDLALLICPAATEFGEIDLALLIGALEVETEQLRPGLVRCQALIFLLLKTLSEQRLRSVTTERLRRSATTEVLRRQGSVTTEEKRWRRLFFDFAIMTAQMLRNTA